MAAVVATRHLLRALLGASDDTITTEVAERLVAEHHLEVHARHWVTERPW